MGNCHFCPIHMPPSQAAVSSLIHLLWSARLIKHHCAFFHIDQRAKELWKQPHRHNHTQQYAQERGVNLPCCTQRVTVLFAHCSWEHRPLLTLRFSDTHHQRTGGFPYEFVRIVTKVSFLYIYPWLAPLSLTTTGCFFYVPFVQLLRPGLFVSSNMCFLTLSVQQETWIHINTCTYTCIHVHQTWTHAPTH